MLLPVTWFMVGHWWVRWGGNLSHYQLLGYVSSAVLVLCVASGVVLTWQAVVGSRIGGQH